jgi:Flp pilus assembly pilin Flp
MNTLTAAAAWFQARIPADDGQTVIEYALVVGVVSVALIALMAGFGSEAVSKAASKIDGVIP